MPFILALLVLLLTVSPASAEWAVDLYGGYTSTGKADATLASSIGVSGTLNDVKFDGSGTGGGRVGYWFPLTDIASFGIGLDLFYFGANVGQQTVPAQAGGFSGTAQIDPIKISVLGLGFDVLKVRLHLQKNEKFPQGQLQPYASVGPALFNSTLKDSTNFFPNNQSKTDTALGVKVGVGLQYLITPNVGFFGEYRFTHFTTDASFQDSTPPPSTETLSTTLNTHHLVGGLAFHF